MKKLLPLLLAVLMLAGCTAPDQSGESAEAPAVRQSESAEVPAEAPALPTRNPSGYRSVSEQEAIPLLAQMEGYIILDVRTASEFVESHIPGAINIANEDIGTEEIPVLPDKAQVIFVYCRSGNRSKQASVKLAALGYTNIIEFGGMINWTGETVSGAE